MKKKEKRHEEETSKAEDVKEKVMKEEAESKNADSVIEEVSALDKKKQEYDALWDRFLRLQAEFDNYKKRSYKERAEFIKEASSGYNGKHIGYCVSEQVLLTLQGLIQLEEKGDK